MPVHLRKEIRLGWLTARQILEYEKPVDKPASELNPHKIAPVPSQPASQLCGPAAEKGSFALHDRSAAALVSSPAEGPSYTEGPFILTYLSA